MAAVGYGVVLTAVEGVLGVVWQAARVGRGDEAQLVCQCLWQVDRVGGCSEVGADRTRPDFQVVPSCLDAKRPGQGGETEAVSLEVSCRRRRQARAIQNLPPCVCLQWAHLPSHVTF